MADDEPAPSNVVPVLVAALICDVAVADPSSGKKNLIGIFDRIFVREFPAQRPMSLYLKLSDAQGLYEIEVLFVQLKSGNVLGKGQGKFQLKDRLSSADFFLDLPPVLIPTAGRYEFQIFTNGTLIGSAFLDAVQRPT